MPNNIKVGSNSVVAIQTATFDVIGLTSINTTIVYEIDGAITRSWKPGRTLNAINGTQAGKGYYVISKELMDKTLYFAPPFAQTGIACPNVTAVDIDIIKYSPIRWGWKDTGSVLSEVAILQAANFGLIESGANFSVDYRTNSVNRYLWFALPSAEPTPLNWEASSANKGPIGSSNDLFGPPTTVGAWKFYQTKYKTKNTVDPILIKH